MSPAAQGAPTDAPMTGMTIAQARRAVSDAFRKAGLDSPELDARVLTGHVLALDHAGLAAESTRRLDAETASTLAELAERRIRREPVARILGAKEFWGLTLRITAATLVPRPETETVVEAALAAIDRGGARTRSLQIADLGTGSGALLIALLSELPHARGIGTDVNVETLTVARENAGRFGIAARAQFIACDFGAALADGFDLVVCNPPYIASGDIAGLASEVRCDPHRALDGGVDGLDCYRALASQAKRLLNPSGDLVVELGAGQNEVATELFVSAGLAIAATYADLIGIPRALHVRLGTTGP